MYLVPARFLFVILCFLIVTHIKRRVLQKAPVKDILAVLDIENGSIRLPITHYETTIGRSKACDVVIPLSVISRQHAVLSMTEDGYWRIADTMSSGGIFVNDKPLKPNTRIEFYDEIKLAGMEMVVMPPTILDQQEEEDMKKYQKSFFVRLFHKLFGSLQKQGSVSSVFAYLNMFQLFAYIEMVLASSNKYFIPISISFGFMAVLPWLYKPIARKMGITDLTAEATAFFLMTLGVCTTASAAPQDLYKQLIAIILGLIIFCIMCTILKNLATTMKFRRYAAILSLVILAVNIVIGTTKNGQKNWISIGPLSIQPSEFVKILFLFASAATLEWLMTTRNIMLLTGYSVACIGFLFLMGDFGTALIFFFAYLVMIFMTSGDVRAVAMSTVSAVMGAGLLIRFRPYITSRFNAWRKVWHPDYLNDVGFQQTRALMAIASGGLLGLGGGRGFLKNVFASDTDLVFAVLAEEWGLIIALLAISCYLLLVIAAIRSHQRARSSYYVITACGAATMFLFQVALNLFGTVDVLPLTGVTMPFVSNGGSSIMASWGMLSFITAALNFKRPKMKRTTTVSSFSRRETGGNY